MQSHCADGLSPGEETMKNLRRSSLSRDAYTFVRALFLDGDRYGEGDKISVEEFSRELGVSRTPLWGAIYRLEAEGIVRRRDLPDSTVIWGAASPPARH